jgi:ribosomal protein S6--L-glutamate ligase
MQHGDYILDRYMVHAIEQICVARGARLSRFSDNWILEIRKGDSEGRIVGYKFSLNNSASANIAQDKVATYELLTTAGIAAVPHVLVRSKAKGVSSVSMTGEVVLKPLVGTSGHLVQVHGNATQAMEYILRSSVESWALSPRLDIVTETRVILMDGKILLSYEKHPIMLNGLKMFNLGLGATPRKIEIDQATARLAADAQKTLGLRLCAVDIVETRDGKRMVLEVNDGIMMEHFSRYSKEYKQNAYDVLEQIIDSMIDTR